MSTNNRRSTKRFVIMILNSNLCFRPSCDNPDGLQFGVSGSLVIGENIARTLSRREQDSGSKLLENRLRDARTSAEKFENRPLGPTRADQQLRRYRKPLKVGFRKIGIASAFSSVLNYFWVARHSPKQGNSAQVWLISSSASLSLTSRLRSCFRG